jgi:hypothetical protein
MNFTSSIETDASFDEFFALGFDFIEVFVIQFLNQLYGDKLWHL